MDPTKRTNSRTTVKVIYAWDRRNRFNRQDNNRHNEEGQNAERSTFDGRRGIPRQRCCSSRARGVKGGPQSLQCVRRHQFLEIHKRHGGRNIWIERNWIYVNSARVSSSGGNRERADGQKINFRASTSA